MKRQILIALAACVLPTMASAQVSALYVSDFNSSRTAIVQGGVVTGMFNRAQAGDFALAIGSTIRSYGRNSGDTGNEYSLSGGFIGSFGNTNPGFVDTYDGASDGNRTWSVAHNDFGSPEFAVIQASSNWAGGSKVWAPADRSSGITYDNTDDTLWIAKNVSGSDGIMHYSTSGALLGGFSFGFLDGAGYGLALDRADNTLWLTGAFGTAGTLFQFSKTGTLLNTVNVSGLNGFNAMSAEFSSVPEPASMAVLGLGVAALLRRRRK
ncbi:MAG: PEP-CTERM sorting domain-containing protein [Fimbriimonadaceae bacterium]